MIWVPGHKVIDVNEIADQLAKLGSESLLMCLEPVCGNSLGVVKNAVSYWTDRDHRKHWDSVSGLE
jgi:hypothetical protein